MANKHFRCIWKILKISPFYKRKEKLSIKDKMLRMENISVETSSDFKCNFVYINSNFINHFCDATNSLSLFTLRENSELISFLDFIQ